MLTLLVLASVVVEGILDAEALRTNHDLGFDRNWAIPDEGEAERGMPGDGGGTGDRVSGGGTSAEGWGAPFRLFMTWMNAEGDYIQGRW